ncbi:hypothetical protein HZ326_2394 [Fusarium oxysporum f. sp. albedinis]|nr:hypothetical protein HZ326_2394 [Fusarium oxysporum f. sp. albedinis]
MNCRCYCSRVSCRCPVLRHPSSEPNALWEVDHIPSLTHKVGHLNFLVSTFSMLDSSDRPVDTLSSDPLSRALPARQATTAACALDHFLLGKGSKRTTNEPLNILVQDASDIWNLRKHSKFYILLLVIDVSGGLSIKASCDFRVNFASTPFRAGSQHWLTSKLSHSLSPTTSGTATPSCWKLVSMASFAFMR